MSLTVQNITAQKKQNVSWVQSDAEPEMQHLINSSNRTDYWFFEKIEVTGEEALFLEEDWAWIKGDDELKINDEVVWLRRRREKARDLEQRCDDEGEKERTRP